MNTPPKHSQLDPGQRREQILDAANALFAERGYDEVSVEDIASSAGVTRGLVHHYFAASRSISRCSSGSPPCASNNCRRRQAASPAPAWPKVCRAA
jgi:AraC-like DNA-binding protein